MHFWPLVYAHHCLARGRPIVYAVLLSFGDIMPPPLKDYFVSTYDAEGFSIQNCLSANAIEAYAITILPRAS